MKVEDRPEDKIVQICPSPGWIAEYKQEDGSIDRAPVACWALTASGDVRGLDAVEYVDFCDDVNNFVQYKHVSMNSNTTRDSNKEQKQ
jgi:hypothetical protein